MLGDGIRRNIAAVTKEERDRFRDAIVKLNDGSLTYSDGRTFFQKQEWVHFAGHSLAHGGVAFMGWHRELCNRFEVLLRVVDPQLSLHYWDWTTDPRDQVDIDGNHFSLFSPDFLGDDGSSGIWTAGSEGSPTNPDWGGEAGPPLQDFGTIVSGQAYPELNGGSETGVLADLPKHKLLWRGVGPIAKIPPLKGALLGNAQAKNIGPNPGGPNLDAPGSLTNALAQTGVGHDVDILTAADALAQAQQFQKFLGALASEHNYVHQYLNGSMGTEHVSLGDPFFFLMHSNLDRLWATWQRAVVGGVPQSWRLDPNQTYGSANGSLSDSFPPWDGTPGVILPKPLIPWVPGSHADDLVNDGMIDSVGGLIPNHQIVSKTAKDPTVVFPASYDTAVHASYIIVNRDTFSTSEINTGKLTYPNAFYVVYDGFTPNELQATPPGTPTNLPTFKFVGASKITAAISTTNPASYENPGGAVDMPQRIMLSFDLKFADGSDFPATSGGENFVNMQASLTYNVDTGTGGTTVTLTAIASTELALVNQPNPYMIDVDPVAQNPYWLSIDTRVFQVKGPGGGNPAGSVLGVTQGDMDTDSSAPFTFIKGVLSAVQGSPSQFDNAAIFPTDETASELELSQKAGPGNTQRVYNYVLARVRYLAPAGVPATGVSVFFRVFSTAVSGLDYDATSGTRGNYRRTGTGNTNASSVPLLGIENDSQGQPETASIPFFASPRVRASSSDSGVSPIASMTTQPFDTTNIQTISGTGSENLAFFGAWLDINLASGDPNYREFPLNPDPANPDGGPFTVATQSIQQLMLNTHHCLVAEIFFWPSGTTSDPIPHDASPASSDRLAQRNLVLVRSGNPGFPATHRVQTTFIVKPSVVPVDQPGSVATATVAPAAAVVRHTRSGRHAPEAQPAAAAVATRYRGPDELIIRWNNVPRNSEATLYMPEIGADEILALSALRQHPTVLKKVDAHTLRCRLADVTFIPLPMNRKGTIAGLMSLTLPHGIRAGQVYRFSVEQYSGFTLKTLGAFQMTIPVRPDAELLPEEIRKLSVMRYIQQAIPATSRWYSIFVRYIDEIAARVRGFGGDPNAVKPSPDGSGGAPPPPVCPPKHVRPPELFCLNIPWEECDIEGELDLKLRFRRRCK